MVLFSPESWHHHNTLHEESKPKNARRERGWVLLSDLSKTERHWGSALQALWELGVREEINLGQSQITLPSRGSCCQVKFVYFLFISLMTFLFYFILFLNFTILYSFCQISKWIRHRYTCVPHPEPSYDFLKSLFWFILLLNVVGALGLESRPLSTITRLLLSAPKNQQGSRTIEAEKSFLRTV